MAGNLDNGDVNDYLEDFGMNIHEGKGVDTIGTTRILNPGMLVSKDWISINIDKTRVDSQIQ